MDAEILYFDSCYVVRLYLEDEGFHSVRERVASCQAVACAWHGQAEVATALYRAFRERRMNRLAFQAALEQFRLDRESGLFVWLPLTDSVQRRLEEVLRGMTDDTFIRAADALHLACAAENGFGVVYSNDRHLLRAAPRFGVEGAIL